MLSFSRSEVVAILDKKEKAQEPPPGYLPVFKVVDLFQSDERNISRQTKRMGIESVRVGRRVFYNEEQVLAAVPLILERSKKQKANGDQVTAGSDWITKNVAQKLLAVETKNFKAMIANNRIEEKDGLYNLVQVMATVKKIESRRAKRLGSLLPSQITTREICDILGIEADNMPHFLARFGLDAEGVVNRAPVYNREKFMGLVDTLRDDIVKNKKRKIKPSPSAAKFLEYARRVKNVQFNNRTKNTAGGRGHGVEILQ